MSGETHMIMTRRIPLNELETACPQAVRGALNVAHTGVRTRRLQLWTSVTLSLVLCMLASASHATLDSRCSNPPTYIIRCAPELEPMWTKLDDAREAYRGGFPTLKSHAQSVAAFKQAIIQYGQSPQQILKELATGPTGFSQYVGTDQRGLEATAGVQESLNELMAGQALLGNDNLIKGLRTRFPGTGDPSDPDQLTLLTNSVTDFRKGINDAIEELRQRPEGLRASGNIVQQFPIFVANTPKPPAQQGETVVNEFNRFGETVYRHALAANAIGRRKFFFENTSPAGKNDAARSLKRAAQVTYLNTALLTALQTRDDFQNNNGNELKRQVLESQRVFDDVLAGFNPLKLLGDFVPRQPVENFLDNFDTLVASARTDEDGYHNLGRQYDVDQTSLATELQNQRERYLDEMEALTGILSGDIQADYDDLQDVEDRERLFADAEAGILDSGNPGQMRQAQVAIEQAAIDARAAFEELRQIPEKIRIEEQRAQGVAIAKVTFGTAINAATLAADILSAIEFKTEGQTSVPVPNPGKLAAARVFKAYANVLALTQDITIEGINTAATVKGLLLQQGLAYIGIERAAKNIEAQKAALDQLRARLQRAVRNYFAARSNLVTAYFSNPAYRLSTDLAKENADASFEAAMVQGYFAAKSLEYEWAERFSNPVERIGTGNPEPIGDTTTFGPFVRAESVFSARSVGATGAPRPSLDQFRQALSLWDQKMRQLRGNELQDQFVETISMREDILGYKGGDERMNQLLFSNFVAKNRVPGRNPDKPDVVLPFSLSIADQRLFPAEANLKLVNIRVNIKSRPPRVAAEADRNNNPFRAELVMLDEAVLRTFFADFYGGDDDLLVIDLEEGRSLSTSPFRALVQATLDGLPAGLPPNVQLANLSPAVSRWVLRLDMTSGQNIYLIPEYIDDIELTLTYKFGRPRSFTF